MLENDANSSDAGSSSSQNNDYDNSSTDYLNRASKACASGDMLLGMHLYLAAFEQARNDNNSLPTEEALTALKQAWHLACVLKERSIAEYIFERLEPYLDAEETAKYAEQLQDLALDKLEEYGLSREELESMTDMISQDFLGLSNSPLVKIENLDMPFPFTPSTPTKDTSNDVATTVLPEASNVSEAMSGLDNSSDVKDSDAESDVEDADDVSDVVDEAREDKSDNSEASSSTEENDQDRTPHLRPTLKALTALSQREMAADAARQSAAEQVEQLTYDDLVGYDDTITLMREFGVGLQKDPQFTELVNQLNDHHGLDRMPACDALLFRSPAREDAGRFMAATVGELGLPAIRMRMEENLQGMPVLCVMAEADHQPSLSASHSSFEGPGVLVLEDLDLWISPLSDHTSDDLGGFLMATLSRGAREAIALINSAVENPDVFVLASASDVGQIDPFFYDLLEPLSVIDIDYPTDAERSAIWTAIMREHPSLEALDGDALVRFSTHMPRYDMYMAAREAVEETYKAGLMARECLPVTLDNLLDKLAAYQPLDSEEYKALEEAVVKDFSRDLDNLEDLLNGEEH